MQIPSTFGLTLAVAAVALLLPACNRAPDTAEISGDSATRAAAVTGSVGRLAAALAPAYPGASVKGEFSAPGSDGHITMWETPDPIAKVIAFYDAKAKAAGITPTFTGNTEDGAIRAYQDADADHAVMLAISKQGDGKGSAIAITVSRNTDDG